jgi:hypothetical protein
MYSFIENLNFGFWNWILDFFSVAKIFPSNCSSRFANLKKNHTGQDEENKADEEESKASSF